MILNNADLKPRQLRISSGEIINVTPVPLRRSEISSPWCFAVNLTPPVINDANADFGVKLPLSTPSSTSLLPLGTNFLATQVWPSSRIASRVIERYINPSWKICEVGCGPGLPSLTAARSGATHVVATDVDSTALELVRFAAIEQGLIFNSTNDVRRQSFSTQIFDLTSKDNHLPDADLYILSDVFESSAVAEGAAWHVQTVLSKNQIRASTREQKVFSPWKEEKQSESSRVWVFAQSDRAQREIFLLKMKEWYQNDDGKQSHQHLDWTMNHSPDVNSELWLFDLDETMVEYN